MGKPFIRKNKVRDYTYLQLCETVTEEGKSRTKILVHLGREPLSDPVLIRWWRYIGSPLIPLREGKEPGSWSHVIINLDQCLRSAEMEIERDLVVRGLTLLTQGYRLTGGDQSPDYTWRLEMSPEDPGGA